jgi:fused signal recognition particle receptor
MAEAKKGFFRRLFETDLPADYKERLREYKRGEEEEKAEEKREEADLGQRDEAREAAQPHPDTHIGIRADPEAGAAAHRPAAADSATDSEAGLAETGEPEGRIAPLKPPTAEPAEGIATEELEQLPTEATVVPPPAEPAPPSARAEADAPRESWFQRLRDGLTKSSNALTGGIAGVFTKRRLDDAMLQDLEDLLIQADLGVATATRITDRLASERYDKAVEEAEVRAVLAAEVEKALAPVARPLAVDGSHRPFAILVVGVNGTGKTTTIGKLAAKLRGEGRTVWLAAGDTFRAAAIEQLKIWGERTGSPVVAREQGADAAGLAFDAMAEARKAGADVLIVDTAGRLHNRSELMAELEKVIRVIRKHDPSAPHAVLLTLDATTGQNAMQQVEVFREKAGVTGLVMTKLDGTARGGILVAVAEKYGLPVHFIGVGEKVEDLQPFAARDFARAIAGLQP